ncbi:MAG: YggT family protein [Deltaproteobacteria bacterium]|nr:YggT family protein [Deltaproteobacteria bacterium]MBI2501532.1 YggT family protein [Deltaproteobacteria bacterium]
MIVLGYLLQTIARVLDFLIDMYTFIVAIAVLISWVRPDPYNPIVRFLYMVTEPCFRLARRLLPSSLRYKTGIDFSPILVFILLIIADTMIVGLLREAAVSILSK